ncbi:peptidase M23 [Amylibacter ulvae]|uniref:Peptidase M23 n=2 Tax=Paramylibacter ulvae TaxID=1651968 RepID=A0ABQ3CUA0_9RHOB|nr:peptidase M23 [Amylibacter ulvae]
MISALLITIANVSYANDIALQFPLDCSLGQDCFVQQFMDHDDTDNARDFTCGHATYDGHKGTDFRIKDLAAMKRGVPVLAVADGQIVALRDDMADQLWTTPEQKAAIKGRECGNGLVIQHANGYQSQYCHMRLNSVTVENKDMVKAGDVLGMVGASGNTQFPHLHITMRKARRVIDPFSIVDDDSCAFDRNNTIWDGAFLDAYDPQITQIFSMGFAPSAIKIDDIQQARFAEFSPQSETPALVAFASAINMRAGDVFHIAFRGPNGVIANTKTDPLDRAKSRYLRFAGKKKPDGGWPSGDYIAEFSILRDGDVIETETITAKIP